MKPTFAILLAVAASFGCGLEFSAFAAKATRKLKAYDPDDTWMISSD